MIRDANIVDPIVECHIVPAFAIYAHEWVSQSQLFVTIEVDTEQMWRDYGLTVDDDDDCDTCDDLDEWDDDDEDDDA